MQPKDSQTTKVSHIKQKAGWSVWERICAVIQNDDTIKHDTFNEECECNPWWDGHVLVHEAKDGRKQY